MCKKLTDLPYYYNTRIPCDHGNGFFNPLKYSYTMWLKIMLVLSFSEWGHFHRKPILKLSKLPLQRHSARNGQGFGIPVNQLCADLWELWSSGSSQLHCLPGLVLNTHTHTHTHFINTEWRERCSDNKWASWTIFYITQGNRIEMKEDALPASRDHKPTYKPNLSHSAPNWLWTLADTQLLRLNSS